MFDMMIRRNGQVQRISRAQTQFPLTQVLRRQGEILFMRCEDDEVCRDDLIKTRHGRITILRSDLTCPAFDSPSTYEFGSCPLADRQAGLEPSQKYLHSMRSRFG